MSTGSVSDAVADALNSLVDRGRRSTEKINEKINEKLSDKITSKVAEILTEEVDRRLGPLQAQIDELSAKLATLETSGARPVAQTSDTAPAEKNTAEKNTVKKSTAKKSTAKKIAGTKVPENGTAAPRARGTSGSV